MPALLWRFLGAGTPARPGRQDGRGDRRARRKAAQPPGSGGQQPDGSEHEPTGEPAGGAPSSPDGKLLSAAAAGGAGTLGVAAVRAARHWGFLLKAVSVHGADLAARLANSAAAPLHARWRQELAEAAPVQRACALLGLEGLADLQDLMNCILLSEHVYKIVDHPLDSSVGMINAVKAEFPPHLVTLSSVQWAGEHVRHRFLLGESSDALYVAFMGTKLPRDMATNANLFQEEVVLDAAMLASGASADLDAPADGQGPAGSSSGSGGSGGSRTLAAHRGFLARARAVPIQALYAEARARGKRLVLTGHSLGGAVASLCAVRLLQHLPPSLYHTVSVYGFATPALGNEALAATVAEAGWGRRIQSYLNPDDPIPQLLSGFRREQQAGAKQAAAAAAADAAAAAPAMSSRRGSTSAAAPAAAEAAGEQMRPMAVAQAAMLATAAAAAAVTGVGAADVAGVNNIQSAPRLAAGTQSRLHRIASHVAAGSEAAEGRQLLGGGGSSSLPRSVNAPTLLGDAAPAATATADAAAAAAAADAAAAAAEAVSAAVLGGGRPAPGMRSAAAAAAAAAEGSKRPRHGWLGRPLRRAGSAALAAAAPPVRAVVERAGSAARLVAVPLSAAASVPMRAAPQYLPLGRQLWVLPSGATTAKPAAGSGASGADLWPAALPAAPPAALAGVLAAPVARGWPWAGLWRAQGAAAQDAGSQDEEDNVDVAAAASLAAGPAGGDAEAGARRRRGVFESHRMATYRNRLLSICHGALEGHLLLRSLPMLPSLPRPGDVAATELVAPPMFPLRAVATVKQPAAAAAPASLAGTPAAASKPAAAGSQQAAVAEGGEAGATETRGGGFWQRLLARAAQQQKEEPVELLIRVDGRGLGSVTRAWVEGLPPGPTPAAPGAAPGGGAAQAGSGGSGAPAQPAAAAVAEVSIVQQPAPVLPALSGGERPPLPVVGHLSAFVSWLAVTLGWVALLRQLQPAGRADYMLARVRLPAEAVRSAQRAAQNPLLPSVIADGPSLLQGLHIGPQLSLRLQSDFAEHSVPLDIRVATHLPRHPGWPWPWRRQQVAIAPATQAAQQPQQQLLLQQAPRGQRWWDWPAGGASSGQL